MSTHARNVLAHGMKHKLAVVLVATALVLGVGGTAFALVTTSSGGTISRVMVVTGNAVATTAQPVFVNLPGAQLTI